MGGSTPTRTFRPVFTKCSCAAKAASLEICAGLGTAMGAARVQTVAFQGIEAVPVDVQAQFTSGLVAFVIVGLPDKAIKEAGERVRAALASSGLSLPPKRVVVNL